MRILDRETSKTYAPKVGERRMKKERMNRKDGPASKGLFTPFEEAERERESGTGNERTQKLGRAKSGSVSPRRRQAGKRSERISRGGRSLQHSPFSTSRLNPTPPLSIGSQKNEAKVHFLRPYPWNAASRSGSSSPSSLFPPFTPPEHDMA